MSDTARKNPQSQASQSRIVQLMLTCLCDAFYGEVGIATVEVLEAAGCRVLFPAVQTCCGQPPFNAGDWKAAIRMAERCRSVFDLEIPIVTPSASCAAMVREGYRMLQPEKPAPQCLELAEYLVKRLRVDSWPPRPHPPVQAPPKIAFHRACHGRALHLGDVQERLLALAGFELIPFAHPEQCCGFGGAFSVSHPAVSASIGGDKLKSMLDAGAGDVVSGDMGCLMHLNGIIRRENLPLRSRHYAQLLAEAL